MKYTAITVYSKEKISSDYKIKKEGKCFLYKTDGKPLMTSDDRATVFGYVEVDCKSIKEVVRNEKTYLYGR